jgi:ribosomal protein L37AE/L43A
MAHGFERGLFFILKSPNGITDFRQIGAVEHGNNFGQITREEFCVARYILNDLEGTVMKKFTRVMAFQVASRNPCPACTDKDTNQKIGISRCRACFSTGREGGYLPGMWTYMRIMEHSPNVKLDSPDGAGSSEPTKYKARLLAFPSLTKDDLLVDPAADNRYLVDSTDVSTFKGKIPIVMLADLQLLRRNDIRYKIPVENVKTR